MGVSMYRPTCYEEFQNYKKAGVHIQCTCLSCQAEFSPKNVHTGLGWKETQISGYCEDCWDNLFKEDEDVPN